MGKRRLFTAGVLAMGFLAGCSTPSNIEIRDNNVLTPAVRLSYDLSSDEKKDTLGLDADLSYVRGTSSQTLINAEKIVFGNSRFDAPVIVDQSYGVFSVLLGGHAGAWAKNRFGAELLGGVNLLKLDVKLQSGTKKESHGIFKEGGYLGLKLIFKPADRVKIYARHINAFDLGTYGTTTDELGVSVRLFSTISAFADWRWYGLRIQKPSTESDIRVNVSGPQFGVGMAF